MPVTESGLSFALSITLFESAPAMPPRALPSAVVEFDLRVMMPACAEKVSFTSSPSPKKPPNVVLPAPVDSSVTLPSVTLVDEIVCALPTRPPKIALALPAFLIEIAPLKLTSFATTFVSAPASAPATFSPVPVVEISKPFAKVMFSRVVSFALCIFAIKPPTVADDDLSASSFESLILIFFIVLSLSASADFPTKPARFTPPAALLLIVLALRLMFSRVVPATLVAKPARVLALTSSVFEYLISMFDMFAFSTAPKIAHSSSGFFVVKS